MLRPITGLCSNFPPAAMLGLRDRYGLVQAVETGTCSGGTALLLGLAFRSVTTVEFDPEVYEWPRELLRPMQHVERVFANSVDYLATRAWRDEPPTLFYLDAHATRANTDWRPPTLVPVLDELKAIGGLHGKHAIVMDDFWTYNTVASVVDQWPEKPVVFGHPPENPGEYAFQALTLDECPWGGWL